jgi:hypothetical protein
MIQRLNTNWESVSNEEIIDKINEIIEHLNK